jgi:hypothetical protein
VAFPETFDDPERGKLYRKLFLTEASLAGKLQHPHICQIYDAVADEKLSYIVMEYVDGGTLEKFCRPEMLLPVDRVVELVFKCTRALEFAHKAGVTHRDIKPANILYTGRDRRQDQRFRRGAHQLRRHHPGERHRLAGLHVARAGEGPSARSPHRHLLDGRGDVSPAHRPPAVLGGEQLHPHLPDRQRRAAAALAFRPACRPRSTPSCSARWRRTSPSATRAGRTFSAELAAAFRSEHFGARKAQEFADSDRFETLRRLPFFENFSDAELWEVARISTWRHARTGEALMREGEPGDYFCILAQGEVTSSKHGKLLNLLRPASRSARWRTSRRRSTPRRRRHRGGRREHHLGAHQPSSNQASEGCRHKFDRAFMDILVARLAMANLGCRASSDGPRRQLSGDRKLAKARPRRCSSARTRSAGARWR